MAVVDQNLVVAPSGPFVSELQLVMGLLNQLIISLTWSYLAAGEVMNVCVPNVCGKTVRPLLCCLLRQSSI